MTKKIAIIGAGPAGMTAAYELAKAKAGLELSLFEASNSVGGMAKTITALGQKVDIGPHRFFSSDPRINKVWLEVAGRDYEMVNRLSRIYYKKKFYFYPLKALNALTNMGFISATLCVFSYFWRLLFPLKDESTFQNWVINRFGDRLFSIFFKSYTEKLWGISCQVLDADFAAQRIKKLSLLEAIKNALFSGKGNKHKTLADQFAYPIGGTGVIYDRMAKSFSDFGGKLNLATPIKRVLVKNKKVTGIELMNGQTHPMDTVISSMPITDLVLRMDEIPDDVRTACNQLRFRNTILVYLKIDSSTLFPDQWLYVHDNSLKTGRVTNFRNWSPSLYGDDKDTILTLEYWCYDQDDIWKMQDTDLINLAEKEIRSTGLVSQKNKILGGFVFKVPKSYPVYDNGYKTNLAVVEKFLDSIENLHAIGRYGAFKYNNQDHSILMGVMVAENIIQSKAHDLWKINTDYEYQEGSKITATGLEPA